MSGKSLAGRRALVTGASRGIGAATVRALAEAGALVAGTARTVGQLDTVMRQLGRGHAIIAADIATDAGLASIIEGFHAWSGGASPDILVNNAGVFPRAALHTEQDDSFARTLAVNLSAPFKLVSALLGGMRTRGSGDIVTVGSVADRNAFAENAAYSASKYGMRAVHEVLRAETHGTGVRAILVSPGPVDTDIWSPHEQSLGAGLPPRRAMLRADDVARAITFAVEQPPHVDIEELRLARS